MLNLRKSRQVIDLYGFFAPIRVNPVILYARTVILGPENAIRPLRISEKKFGRKKMPSQTRQNFPLSEKWQVAKKIFQPLSNFFTRFDDGFQPFSSIL